MAVATRTTKLDTFFDLVEKEKGTMAVEVFGDIDSLTVAEKAQVVDSLLGLKLAIDDEDLFFLFGRQLIALGIAFVYVDATETGRWIVAPAPLVSELVNTINVTSDITEFAGYSFPAYAAEDDVVDLDFRHQCVVGLVEQNEDGQAELFIGVPPGGYVDWTPRTEFEADSRIVRNLHFVIRPQLNDGSYDDRSEFYSFSFTTDVRIGENGQLALLEELSEDQLSY